MARNIRSRLNLVVAVLLIAAAAHGRAVDGEKKAIREEGQYKIYAAGREIGVEKYTLVTAGDKVTSSSSSSFNNPGDNNQKVTVETRLEMDAQFQPQNYEVKSEVAGERGTVRGNFAPNQVIFDYTGNGVSDRSGLLVGSRYTILDTNTFHHFIFLARLFKYGSGNKPQTFDVVIPQEKDTGTLKISEIGDEPVVVGGKKVSATHLLIDSGSLQIHLWVDSRHTPVKIALPGKGVEVLRSN